MNRDESREPKRILVVEDDQDIQKVLIDQLALDGYKPRGVATGKEALEEFDAFSPDLVILDLSLPDIDGLIICQHLRKKSDVPVIILSARESLADKIRGLDLGADDYMTKPFEFLELAARIKACIRRGTQNRDGKEKIIRAGAITIFQEQGVVTIDGTPVNLTRKEFDLLLALAENRNKVVKRKYLCSRLWKNNEVYPWSRALDVHIRRLRQKIEPNPAKPTYIITHSGVGYRFRHEDNE